MKYLRQFNISEAYNAAKEGSDFYLPCVSLIKDDMHVEYDPYVEDVPGPWVTFTAQEDNSSIGLAKLSTNQTLEYSTDKSTWNTFNKSTNISLNNNDKVYVRGVLSADNTEENYTQFKMSGKIAASGSCNALWNYEDLNASFKQFCGYRMFKNCTSLTTAPELPTTELTGYCCYYCMFWGCTSLTAAPKLPATRLVESCYANMFQDCTSLTAAPELPATELANFCYFHIFQSCTSLTAAPELPATTLTGGCYQGMFSGTSLTIAPELPATELAQACYQDMFRNCKSLTTAPELPAKTLARTCYSGMFGGCTSLTHIKCLATDMSAGGCLTGWVRYAPNTGTFIKHPDATWATGVSGIPEGWTIEDAVL